MPSKKDQQNFWSFYPSEPFKNGHFNVRHPVTKTNSLVRFLGKSAACQSDFGFIWPLGLGVFPQMVDLNMWFQSYCHRILVHIIRNFDYSYDGQLF